MSREQYIQEVKGCFCMYNINERFEREAGK